MPQLIVVVIIIAATPQSSDFNTPFGMLIVFSSSLPGNLPHAVPGRHGVVYDYNTSYVSSQYTKYFRSPPGGVSRAFGGAKQGVGAFPGPFEPSCRGFSTLKGCSRGHAWMRDATIPALFAERRLSP